jgi:hypothetical protein
MDQVLTMPRIERWGELALVFKGDPLTRVVRTNRIIIKTCFSCVTAAYAPATTAQNSGIHNAKSGILPILQRADSAFPR